MDKEVLEKFRENNIIAIKDFIKGFHRLKKKTTEVVKKFVQSEQYDINLRWDIFLESGLGAHDTYFHNPTCGINWDEVNLKDNFYYRKKEMVCVKDLLDSIQDKVKDNELIVKDFDEEQYKRYFIDKFVSSFTND